MFSRSFSDYSSNYDSIIMDAREARNNLENSNEDIENKCNMWKDRINHNIAIKSKTQNGMIFKFPDWSIVGCSYAGDDDTVRSYEYCLKDLKSSLRSKGHTVFSGSHVDTSSPSNCYDYLEVHWNPNNTQIIYEILDRFGCSKKNY